MAASTSNQYPFTLRFYPDPCLAKRCEEVVFFGPHTRKLAKDMLAAMKVHGGVGLAANQMGQLERLFVVSGSILENGEDLALFNPRIVERAAASNVEEGCLSLPGVVYVIPERSQEVRVEFQNVDGLACSLVFKGLSAVCAQHELDHLDGLTMLDRLSALKSGRIKARMAKEAKAEAKS